MQACKPASITASTPTADFVVNGDGTVTHTRTGLMWKQCSEGVSTTTTACDTGTASTHTWQAALVLAAADTTATFTDWRVPNRKELRSIVEEQCVSPSINATIFPGTVSVKYWSVSPFAGSAARPWLIHFNTGFDNVDFKTLTYSVRLVRGGQ